MKKEILARIADLEAVEQPFVSTSTQVETKKGLYCHSTTDTSSTDALNVQNSSDTELLTVAGDGTPWVNQAWVVASTRKDKINIVALGELVPGLSLYQYHRPNGRIEYGLLADEVQDWFPDLVTATGVDYQSVILRLLLLVLTRTQRADHF